MSVLVVGLSHRTAPMELLEQVALQPSAQRELAGLLRRSDDISEAVVLATCNRVEVLVEAQTFHGALAGIGESLSAVTDVGLDVLSEHLYVHYEERAVCHVFSLACGLESMAVGESHILSQLRESLAAGQRTGAVGSELNPLLQQALRVGKRAHAETGLDTVARSLVGLGLGRAATVLADLSEVRAVVVGAGAMSGLAVATLTRAGVRDLTVVNRTRGRASRLASEHGGKSADWTELEQVLGAADLVISCTGAVGHVVSAETMQRARCGRSEPMVVVDLALPHDVDPAVADLPGVHRWGLAELHAAVGDDALADGVEQPAVQEVRDLVTVEVATYLTDRRAQLVAPTLAALRARAGEVVGMEYDRLVPRLPELDEQGRAEVRRTLQRVVDKLLHTPTVRVKALQSTDGAGDYADALSELFDLDPRQVAVVSSPPRTGPGVRP